MSHLGSEIISQTTRSLAESEMRLTHITSLREIKAMTQIHMNNFLERRGDNDNEVTRHV